MAFIKCYSRLKKIVTLIKVSDEDYEKVSSISWYINSCGYAVHSLPGGVKLLLHRYIMGAEKGQVVDHINHDKTDCRRENLRFVTVQENSINKTKTRRKKQSIYKGVSANSKSALRPWRAMIHLNGSQKFLGTFKTEIEASQAYDRAALKYFGEFACLNNA